MSSVDGNGRKIPEDEIRVKRFFIQEVEKHPSIWKHCRPDQKRGMQGKRSTEDWHGILFNMQEAFKSDSALLAKYKADTVMGLREMWRLMFEVHRRRWANEIDNSGKFQLQT